MPEQPDVHAGQVWEQRSGDLKGRRLKVLELAGNGYARVELIRNPTYKPNDRRGRKTYMQTKTLRPPRFVLVEEDHG